MEVPGLKSLFTRITLTLPRRRASRRRAALSRPHDPVRPAVPAARHRARRGHADGTLVATALLRSYVPFSPAQADLSRARATGSSRRRERARGQGRARRSAAAAAWAPTSRRRSRWPAATSTSSARQDDDDAPGAARGARGARRARGVPRRATPAMPAGAQPTLEPIRARHGRLDLLVLNACAPPAVERIGRESAGAARAVRPRQPAPGRDAARRRSRRRSPKPAARWCSCRRRSCRTRRRASATTWR